MINIDNFMRQHKEIVEELDCICEILNKQDYKNHLDEFVSHINKLAGKLKVHLSTEDKFLYPNLINGEDGQLKNMAKFYIDEIGNLSNIVTDYINKFNTKSKINERIDTFISETRSILNKVRKRIQKEEIELYRLIAEKSI